MRILIFILSLFNFCNVNAQFILADMPEAVSNNAVTGAYVNGVPHVYSFSGIDSTKQWNGIHKRAFRYNTETDSWETIAELPSGTGRIAAGASTIKNKIYIIGGYEVFANGNERTLDEVHIYNPETNEYEPNGKPMPVPVDDHVQVVWKDSLIICVTGWSQNTNVRDVQIYNPTTDEWSIGTSVPNSSTFKAFGASGIISEDTLYYIGGARIGSSFPASTFLRKGYINPNDPTDITWSAESNPLSIRYRSAASLLDNKPIWFGGSKTTYNYDGIAYNNSGGVEPTESFITYDLVSGKLNESLPNSFYAQMDYRGVATFPRNFYYFCGGMESGQKVSKKTFVSNILTVNTNDFSKEKIEVYPNPTSSVLNVKTKGKFKTELYDFYGGLIIKNEFLERGTIYLSKLVSGLYILKITKHDAVIDSQIIILK